MVADTYDPFLGLILQGTGNNNNNWGNTCNVAMVSPAARAIAGVATRSNTGGSLNLSGSPPPAALRQDVDMIQLFNGALISDLTIIVPNLSKLWWFENDTSGSFNVFVQVPSGVSPNGLVQIPQGLGVMVMCDGAGNLRRHDRAEVGSFRISGKASAGFGELACNGASLLRAEFPDLYSAIGTNWGSADSLHFTLPNFTDTGRFLRSSSGSLAVGTYQSNQNAAHTHSITGAPSAGTLGTDSQGSHTHSATPNEGSGHSHGGGASNSGFVAATGLTGGSPPTYANYGNTGLATTGMSITVASAGAHTHNITGAPGLGTLGTASQGGSEARPEAAVVLTCIRY
jgi:microcystin-dependent protein